MSLKGVKENARIQIVQQKINYTEEEDSELLTL